MEKSGKELSKLNAAWTPSEQDTDLEMMTDEERECFRKIGLKMQSFLLLGMEIPLRQFKLDIHIYRLSILVSTFFFPAFLCLHMTCFFFPLFLAIF